MTPGDLTAREQNVYAPATGGTLRVTVTASWPAELGNEVAVVQAIVEAARRAIDEVLDARDSAGRLSA